MAVALKGKGIWARPRGGTSELERAISIAQQTRATHVLYKVAHGSTYLSGSLEAAQKIRQAGLVPLGWSWLLLNDPTGEAQTVVRAFQDGYAGLVIDSEAPVSGKFNQARQLAQAVKAANVDLNSLYNCSFPNIASHSDLPYEQLNEICRGGLMPMSYGSFFAPGNPKPWAEQARVVIDDWTYGHYRTACQQWGYCPPLYPVLGPYHDEYGAVRMSPEEFQVWLERLLAYEPTFISIFTAAVINDNLLPLIEAYPLGEERPIEPVPPLVWARQVAGVVLYETPDPAARRMQAFVYGSKLEGLARRIASDGRSWLQVRTPAAQLGWAREDELLASDPGPAPKPPTAVAPPPGHLTHVWSEQELNFRSQPVVRDDTLIGRLYPGVQLRIVEDTALAKNKLGKIGQWFNVQVEPDGPQGWAAAWYVTSHGPGHGHEPSITHVRVQSAIGLNVRQGPSELTQKVWHVPDGTVLALLDLQEASRVGQLGQWLRVRTPSLHEGYVAAWYVVADVPADERRSVSDQALPYGESAWLFGIHGASVNDTGDFRHLFQGSHKTGWVLFTEAIGHQPQSLPVEPQRRARLWDWASSGYGVIVRLNNGYGTAGTLPDSGLYEGFAATCARYADVYLKHPESSPGAYTWVIVIGNEQNNVREHPGGEKNPREHITPQLYARAFNLAYKAIKAVLPNAIVVPGAVDPYNTYPWVRLNGLRYRPLTYFKEMLDGIEELDGFSLHTYTHGPVVDYITRRRVFTDPFLAPGTEHEHYYDFQAYRPFVEAIPARWRDRPVYLSETNHWVVNPDGSPPVGWVNRNNGWVRAAYKEIYEWNSAAHAQQICCVLLYRWQDDAWEIKSKDQVQADFKLALENDYRWRA